MDISGRAEDSRGKVFRWRRNSIRFRMEETHRYRCVITHRLERVDVGGESGDGGRQGRGASGQAQTLQNSSCRVRRMYGRKNFHSAAAALTFKDVQ